MAWDLALLKKFSSTGHFRLLNQVRSELKAQPLDRDQQSRKIKIQARPFKGVVQRSTKRPNALETDYKDSNHSTDLDSENTKSFRDRLNAIDMR